MGQSQAASQPPSAPDSGRPFGFGPFVVDPLRLTLRRDEAVVELTPKAFQLLIALARRRGEIVDKETLFGEVWPHAIVEDNTLARHMSTLRKALRHGSGSPDYIATVSGRGYRFAAPIRDIVAPTPERPTVGLVVAQTPISGAPAALPFERRAAGSERRADEPTSPDAKQMPLLLSHPWPIAALGVALMSAFIVALMLMRTEPTPPTETSLWQLTVGPGIRAEPTWSPDGRFVAYSVNTNGHSAIWVQPSGVGDAIRVTPDDSHDTQPAWSPNGQMLAFRSERDGGGIFAVPALGGAPRRVAAAGWHPAWAPDGSRILFVNALRLAPSTTMRAYTVDANGGAAPVEVLREELDAFEQPFVAWHPDGRISIWGPHRARDWKPVFRTIDLNSGDAVESTFAPEVERQLQAAGLLLQRFNWASSGDALYFEGMARQLRNVWRVGIDRHTLRWVDGPERLTTGPGAIADLAVAPDGVRMAMSINEERPRIWELPLAASGDRIEGVERALTPAGLRPTWLDVSPDGRRLVYQLLHGTHIELRVRGLQDDTDELVSDVDPAQSPTAPRLSPNGSRLSYVRKGHAFVRDYGASVEKELAMPASIDRIHTSAWTGDGTAVVASCRERDTHRVRICILPADPNATAAAPPRIVAAHDSLNLWDPRVSKDGRWIAFFGVERTDGSTSTIYAMPTEGGPWTRLTDGTAYDYRVRWAANGKTVYFESARDALVNVWGRHVDPVSGAAVGALFQLTDYRTPERMMLPIDDRLGFGAAAQKLYVPTADVSSQVWILDRVRR